MVQTDSIKKSVVVVCGPTASGKSQLAVQLAKLLDTAVISADSIAVYKDLYIGTAKPDEAQMEGVKHYLIDCVDADKEFTVQEYADLAGCAIEKLHRDGKIPIICGGTGYYIDALLYKMSYGNCPKDERIREKYQKIFDEKGADYLFSMLKEVDPQSYEILHKNDSMRVIRALEIFELTGKKKSEIIDEKTPDYHFVAYAFDYERKTLYDRINKRVDIMFDDGLIDEVKRLLSNGLSENCQSMQAIGYKEIVEGLKLGLSQDDMKEVVKRNTRRYAKRQLTYFKRLDNLRWLDPNDYSIEAIYSDLKNERIIL